MVEEDLERDDDDEYLSDMVIINITYHYRLIKVRASLLIALEMRSIRRSKRRGRKTSCRRIFCKDNVISSIKLTTY